MYKYLTGICGIAAVLSLATCGTAQLNSYEDYKENVLFSLHTRSNFESPEQIFTNNVSSLSQSSFDSTRKTLVVIHGYKNNLKSPMFQEVKNGALESHDFNVIGVDWEYFTRSLNYEWVVTNAKPVGDYVSQFIRFLIDQGVSPSDLHLIGHSIGAHVAGFIGKQLQADGHLAARITGLDPALPGFYNLYDATARLNATDAEYVDCIHTCGGMLGIPSPICQADFFPNRGQNVQPGCSIFDLGVCSHGRSFEYFAESFNSTHLFRAKTCKGFSFWVPYNCHDEGALMGYPAGAQRYQGLYSLETNSQSPFAKTIKTTLNY